MGPLETAALSLALMYPTNITDKKMLDAAQLLGQPIPGFVEMKHDKEKFSNGVAYPEEYRMVINTSKRPYKQGGKKLAGLVLHEARHLGPDPSEANAYKGQYEWLKEQKFEKRNWEYMETLRRRMQEEAVRRALNETNPR